jgi:hypothetical protein
MTYGYPPPEEPALVNADEHIPICSIVRLNENPFWSRLQHNRQATASLSPEQLPEREDSIIAEKLLNAEEKNVEELSPFNSEDTRSLFTTVNR